jgi:hypothetical protein
MRVQLSGARIAGVGAWAVYQSARKTFTLSARLTHALRRGQHTLTITVMSGRHGSVKLLTITRKLSVG